MINRPSPVPPGLRPVASVLFWPVVVGLSLAAAGCSRSLDMTALNQSISQGINAQLQLPIATVTCPSEDRPLKAGDAFACMATPKEGGLLTVTVTQKDDAGNVSWEVTKTEGLLDLDKVETSVKAGLKSQADIDATVECDSRWKAIKVGETFQCRAMAGGQKAIVEVTTADTEGNISWKVQ